MSYRHFRAVVFDFFGTLTQAIQRGPAHATIARRLGCDPAEFIDILDRTFLERATGRFGSAAQTLRWVCAQLGVHPSNEQLDDACAARIAAVRADTRLRPDAVAALRALRLRGVRLAVVSDCCHELPAILPGLPIAKMLHTAVYSVEVGVCKPHEAIYLAACTRLGVSPYHCLYVGDGGSHELSGATNVGMTAVRLVERDLGDHLSFGAEPAWPGRTTPSLLTTVSYLDRVESAVSAVIPALRTTHRLGMPDRRPGAVR